MQLSAPIMKKSIFSRRCGRRVRGHNGLGFHPSFEGFQLADSMLYLLMQLKRSQTFRVLLLALMCLAMGFSLPNPRPAGSLTFRPPDNRVFVNYGCENLR